MNINGSVGHVYIKVKVNKIFLHQWLLDTLVLFPFDDTKLITQVTVGLEMIAVDDVWNTAIDGPKPGWERRRVNGWLGPCRSTYAE